MPRERFYLVGFIVAVAMAVAAMRVGELIGWHALDPVATFAICIALTLVFPESFQGPGFDKRTTLRVAMTVVALCAIWWFGFWIRTTHSMYIEWSWGVIPQVFGLVVITPWFEEKLFRHLLLSSLLRVVRPLFAVLAVSVLFAVAHKGMIVWALVVSLTLCWMRLSLNAKTIHCAIAHGCVNAFVLALYLIAK